MNNSEDINIHDILNRLGRDDACIRIIIRMDDCNG